MTAAQKLAQAKSVAREPCAWPGGYAKLLLMCDGELLCPKCVRSEFPAIARSTIQKSRDGWQCEAITIHWEGPAEFCAHCNAELPSEYGDPNEGKE